MAGRESMGTNVDQGVIARVSAGLGAVSQAVRYAISGVDPNGWFGPQQPMQPAAQEKTEGRVFDYPFGVNLRITPRSTENVSFAQLRGFADAYDLLRLVIETRKDQLESFDWEIVPKDESKKAEDMQSAVDKVTDKFNCPSDEHDTWEGWLRAQLEDLFVCDAITIYPRKTKGGDLCSFDLVDPTTITRKIDDTGRTPAPPSPAYQQVLKGVPANDLTRDTLVYRIRNPRTGRLYGYSPVEQIITTVNIALRRQMSQLSYYTEGNVPEALGQVPDTWTPAMIEDFQRRFDAMMEGNLGQRRKLKFVPALHAIDMLKADLIKDEMDDWLARIICFAFSISPTALMKQINRATSEQMASTAKEEGLIPLLRWTAAHFSRLIQAYLDPNLKFKWKIVNKLSPVEQAKIDKIYADLQVVTPDEIREDSLEKEPINDAEREKWWPAPIPPGLNPDGSPILPKGSPNAGVGAGGGPPASGGKGAVGSGGPPSDATQKALEAAIRALDPERLAKLVDKLRPTIVEVRPEVNVEVGETTINIPRQ